MKIRNSINSQTLHFKQNCIITNVPPVEDASMKAMGFAIAEGVTKIENIFEMHLLKKGKGTLDVTDVELKGTSLKVIAFAIAKGVTNLEAVLERVLLKNDCKDPIGVLIIDKTTRIGKKIQELRAEARRQIKELKEYKPEVKRQTSETPTESTETELERFRAKKQKAEAERQAVEAEKQKAIAQEESIISKVKFDIQTLIINADKNELPIINFVA